MPASCPNLRGASAGAGVGHHVDRVELRFRLLIGGHFLLLHLIEHQSEILSGDARPKIDDHVVAFALGNAPSFACRSTSTTEPWLP